MGYDPVNGKVESGRPCGNLLGQCREAQAATIPGMRKKKSTPRKKTSRSSRVHAASKRSIKRFFWAFSASALTSFSAASCVFNPELREQVSVEAVLGSLGLPGQQESAPRVVPSGAWVQTQFSQCKHFFPNERPPVVPAGSALRELCFSSFAILHDGNTKTPVFVAQRLNRQLLQQAQKIKRTDRFYADSRLPARERAELDDYRGSGYSRGHMAPAADMPTDEAMAQSFSLANMVPQNQRHNAGPWNQIEQNTRQYVQRARGDVYIFTGPVFGEGAGTIGEGRVGVPTHLYKLVHDASTQRSWVHWQANAAQSKAAKPITYQDFLARTGLALLP